MSLPEIRFTEVMMSGNDGKLGHCCLVFDVEGLAVRLFGGWSTIVGRLIQVFCYEVHAKRDKERSRNGIFFLGSLLARSDVEDWLLSCLDERRICSDHKPCNPPDRAIIQLKHFFYPQRAVN